MLKKILGVFAVMCLPVTAYAAEEISIANDTFTVSGVEYALHNAAFERNGEVYLPIDEVMPKCGFSLGWDNALRGTVCENDRGERAVILSEKNTHIIGYKMYRYENPTINIGDLCYVNEAVVEDITGLEVSAAVMLPGMPGTELGDDFRKQGEVVAFSPVFVLNREFIFEQVTINPVNGEYYAAIVNDIAAKLPGVDVYNMLVPNPGEFYAPKEYYTGQTEAFQSIYEKLNDTVIPIKIADALYAHADEHIYFRTDHHWTQRGAYYAWKEFMRVRGETVPELSEFPKADFYEFSGSFMQHVSDKNAIDVPYETLERFLPIYDVTVDIYQDMYMQQKLASIPLVNTNVNNYNCFISGDTPLTVIDGGVKNGRSIAIMKESCGNVLATWAVNNYERVYVIDIRGFYDGSFDIGVFHSLAGFNDLLIESYPTTIESSDLRIGLLSLKGN